MSVRASRQTNNSLGPLDVRPRPTEWIGPSNTRAHGRRAVPVAKPVERRDGRRQKGVRSAAATVFVEAGSNFA